MKTTHTHRGHCQACGRVQAVDTANNLLAKHGYTVDFGYFNGVCTGSDRQPLEVDKSFTEQTIVELSDWVEKKRVLLAEAQDNKVTFSHYSLRSNKYGDTEFEIVSFSMNHVEDEQYTVVAYTEDSLKKHIEQYNQESYYELKFVEVFQKLQSQYVKQISSSISNAVNHAESLKKLIGEVHGKALINVADAEQIIEDLEKDALEDFYKTEMRKITHYVGEPIMEVWSNWEIKLEKKTSVGLVGVKLIHSANATAQYNRDKYTKQCLFNGKRIARNKLIEKLQGDI